MAQPDGKAVNSVFADWSADAAVMTKPASSPVARQSRRAALQLAATATAAAALAPAAAAAEESKKAVPVTMHVDLPSLVLPMATDGRLVNYLFVQVRVHFSDGRSADQINTHQFFARDAVIRAVGRNPIPPGTQPRTYNAAAVQRLIATAVAGCMPNIRVARVEIRAAEFMR